MQRRRKNKKMASSISPGILLSIILMVVSIPFVMDLTTSWSFLLSVPKEVIGFVYMIVCVGIGALVDWLFFRDCNGGGGM